MEGESAFTCCRSTVEVWRCGHTHEHLLKCQWHFPAGGAMSHTTTHRVRIDHPRPCVACSAGQVALQFRQEGPAPFLQAANQGPVIPLQHQQANAPNPYLTAQRRADAATNQPAQGQEPTEESVEETTESDEPEEEEEEEEEQPATQRRPWHNPLAPRNGRMTRRAHNVILRDQKMQREFALKPYRARGARGARGG